VEFFDRIRAAMRSRAPLARRADGEPIEPEVLAAAAALLVSAAYGDDEFAPAERQAIQKSLRKAFGISRDQAAELLSEADASARPADLSAIAASIEATFDTGGRQRILGLVWTVVYADLIVDDAEVALAGEIRRLLGLTPEQSQEARNEAFEWFSTSRSRS